MAKFDPYQHARKNAAKKSFTVEGADGIKATIKALPERATASQLVTLMEETGFTVTFPKGDVEGCEGKSGVASATYKPGEAAEEFATGWVAPEKPAKAAPMTAAAQSK